MKELSLQTQRATERIASRVTELQLGSQSAVKQIEQVSQVVTELGQQTSAIIQAMNTQNAAARVLAETTDDVGATSSDALKAMYSLRKSDLSLDLAKTVRTDLFLFQKVRIICAQKYKILSGFPEREIVVVQSAFPSPRTSILS